MIANKRKNILAIISMIILVLAITIVSFCGNSVAKAEETSVQAVADNSVTSAYVPTAGTFIDGNREYGGFYLNMNVSKKNDTQYDVIMDLTLLTTNYVTDRYYINSLKYYYYGTDVSYVSGNTTWNVDNVANNSGVSLSSFNRGIKGHSFTFPAKDKENNYPVITETFVINVNGANPKICIALNSIEIIGRGLAKDTKIADNNFVYLEVPLTLDRGRVIPVFKYMYNYKNTTFIQNGRYTTLGGPVPSYWVKQAF